MENKRKTTVELSAENPAGGYFYAEHAESLADALDIAEHVSEYELTTNYVHSFKSILCAQ